MEHLAEDRSSDQATSRLKPNFAASHRTSDCPEDPQDQTNDHQYAANRFKDREAGKVSDHREK
jgi:hypothetical protein